MSRIANSYLGQAWLVLLLSLAFGGLLAGVNVGLSGRIEANRRNETLNQIPGLILGSEAISSSQVELAGNEIRLIDSGNEDRLLRVAESEISGHQVFEVRDAAAGSRLGWVARGKGSGYADEIVVLIGLAPDASAITGLYVLSQKETPALGDAITRTFFRDRFIGAPADVSIRITKSETEASGDPSRVLALTAATISSRSVSDIVNQTVSRIRGSLETREESVAGR